MSEHKHTHLHAINHLHDHNHKHGKGCCKNHGKHGHEHKHGEGHVCCGRHHHHDEKKAKVGILLAPFGTSVDRLKADYDIFEKMVAERFPNIEIFRAYTADKIRRKLKAQTVSQALVDMYDSGFTHVAVQPIHTVPGVEYEWTKQQALALQHPRKGLQKISVGLPLITERYIHEVIHTIPHYIPKDIPSSEAIVLIGHGTYHEAHIYYHALESRLSSLAPNYFVGALMGDGLTINDIAQKLKARNFSKVHLFPFMSVPGHHFIIDISSDRPSSWFSKLTAQGFDCSFHEIGTITCKEIANIWLDNLHVALHELGEDVKEFVPAIPENIASKFAQKPYDHGHDH